MTSTDPGETSTRASKKSTPVRLEHPWSQGVIYQIWSIYNSTDTILVARLFAGQEHLRLEGALVSSIKAMILRIDERGTSNQTRKSKSRIGDVSPLELIYESEYLSNLGSSGCHIALHKET